MKEVYRRRYLNKKFCNTPDVHFALVNMYLSNFNAIYKHAMERIS